VRELGADVTIADEKHPSVRDLLLAINKALANGVTDGKPAASYGVRFLRKRIFLRPRARCFVPWAPVAGARDALLRRSQEEKDAQRLGEELAHGFPSVDVEYQYGGMKNAEYWISLDE
jgi:hypothetical protein